MNGFVTKYSGQEYVLPEQLLGNSEVGVDTTGRRLSIPSLWKDSFSSRSYVMASMMGSYPCSLLFPESNIKAILAQIKDDEFKEILERSASAVSVDEQKRFVVPEHARFFDGESRVRMFGSGSHLKIVGASVADEITAEDKELVAHFFRDIE
jgi:DNA-binding transcriptional regulator/RsmH inhibitor MraZ